MWLKLSNPNLLRSYRPRMTSCHRQFYVMNNLFYSVVLPSIKLKGKKYYFGPLKIFHKFNV